MAPGAVRLVLDGYLEAVAEVFFPTAEVPLFPSSSFHLFSSDSSDDDPSLSTFTTSLMSLSPGVLVAVRAGSKIFTEQQGDLLAVPGVGGVFAKLSSSSLIRWAIALCAASKPADFFCSLTSSRALDLWLIACFAVFIERLVSFPVEHENVDQRDLALAWEFAVRFVSFLSKEAASDAFAPSVNLKDADGCDGPSILPLSSEPSLASACSRKSSVFANWVVTVMVETSNVHWSASCSASISKFRRRLHVVPSEYPLTCRKICHHHAEGHTWIFNEISRAASFETRNKQSTEDSRSRDAPRGNTAWNTSRLSGVRRSMYSFHIEVNFLGGRAEGFP